MCRAIGSGSFLLSSLMHGTGSEEARIPVHSSGGGESGIVYLGLRFEKGEAPPAGAHSEPLPHAQCMPHGGRD